MRANLLRPALGLLLAISLTLLAIAGSATAVSSSRRDDLAERIAEFERAFHSTPREPRTPEQRQAAVELLVGLDDPSVAAAVVGAWEHCAQELTRLLEERQRIEAEIAEVIRGQEFGERTLPVSTAEDLALLKTRSRTLAAEGAGLREIEAALGRVIGDMRSEPSLTWLLTRVIGEKKLPLALKLLVAQNAGKLGTPVAESLGKALARAKGSEEIVVLLAGASACGQAARACAPIVIELLSHDDANVREQAAGALARLAVPTGIEPLIARLAQESGHTLVRFGIALEILTGVNLGDNAGAWRAWLSKEGARHVGGRAELGTGRSRLAATLSHAGASGGGDSRYAPSFYGIQLDGHSIVYVIDCSGSMVASITDPEYEDGKWVDAGHDSRIEATKAALIEVLGKLDARDRFNLVCFNDVVRAYAPAMLPARAEERERAQAWVSELGASNATNIHDALQEAFRLAGRGVHDKYYESAVDTIFLLTDGTPTWNDGQVDSTERIFAAVQAWNPLRHVVIHTIGIGKDLNASFLGRIAEENGGHYVQQ